MQYEDGFPLAFMLSVGGPIQSAPDNKISDSLTHLKVAWLLYYPCSVGLAS